MPSPTAWLERHSALGVPLFRLFLGATLVYGTQDNVFSRERMLEFSGFLTQNGFPAPLFSAHLSAWAQFICGVLIAAGAATRPAAAVTVVNFAVALWMVHRNLPFSANIAPLAMFFGSLMLMFHGAGAYAVDAARQRRAGVRRWHPGPARRGRADHGPGHTLDQRWHGRGDGPGLAWSTGSPLT